MIWFSFFRNFLVNVEVVPPGKCKGPILFFFKSSGCKCFLTNNVRLYAIKGDKSILQHFCLVHTFHKVCTGKLALCDVTRGETKSPRFITMPAARCRLHLLRLPCFLSHSKYAVGSTKLQLFLCLFFRRQSTEG